MHLEPEDNGPTPSSVQGGPSVLRVPFCLPRAQTLRLKRPLLFARGSNSHRDISTEALCLHRPRTHNFHEQTQAKHAKVWSQRSSLTTPGDALLNSHSENSAITKSCCECNQDAEARLILDDVPQNPLRTRSRVHPDSLLESFSECTPALIQTHYFGGAFGIRSMLGKAPFWDKPPFGISSLSG